MVTTKGFMFVVGALLCCSTDATVPSVISGQEVAREIARGLAAPAEGYTAPLDVGRQVAQMFGPAAVPELEGIIAAESTKDDRRDEVIQAAAVAIGTMSDHQAAFDAAERLCSETRQGAYFAMTSMPRTSLQRLLWKLLEANEDRPDVEAQQVRRATVEMLIMAGNKESGERARIWTTNRRDSSLKEAVACYIEQRNAMAECISASDQVIAAYWLELRVITSITPRPRNIRSLYASIVNQLRNRNEKIPIEFFIAQAHQCPGAPDSAVSRSNQFGVEIARYAAAESLPEVIAIAKDGARPERLRQLAIDVLASVGGEQGRTALIDVYRGVDGKAIQWVADAALKHPPRGNDSRDLLEALQTDQRVSAETREKLRAALPKKP